jgi:hypothetical protein
VASSPDSLHELFPPGSLPPSVAALPQAVRGRLARQVRAAQRHQANVVENAVRDAVKGAPLPVRGIIRKALLG